MYFGIITLQYCVYVKNFHSRCCCTIFTVLKSSRIRTINRRPRLTVLSMFKIPTWDVKEPTHYSKRVGGEVPGVVAVLLSSKCGWLGVKMFLKRFVVYKTTYAKTATSQKGTLPSAR